MNGLILGRKLREINPDIVLVFLMEHTEYTLEALHIQADYYVIKPYTAEHLSWVMDNARLLSRRHKKQVYIWENRFYDGKVKNLYRKASMDLKNVFEANGIYDVFRKKRGICAQCH